MSDLSSTGARASRQRAHAGGWQTPSAIRAQLLRLMFVPAACVTGLCAALGSGAVIEQPGRPGEAGLLAVLLVGLVVIAVRTRSRAIAVSGDLVRAMEAALQAERDQGEERERATRDWIQWLSELVSEQRGALIKTMEQLSRGQLPQNPATQVAEADPANGDHYHVLEQQVRAFALETHRAVLRASASQQLLVLVTIARRLQSLVTRSLKDLDLLERETEDPDLFEGLLHVDHLVTRLRRHIESVAVVGGAVARPVQAPVQVSTVLRLALSEIEYYSRVKITRPVEGVLRGPAVTDVIHLVAELLENATMFSRPETTVVVQAQLVAAGLAIDIDDRGLRMEREDLEKAARLLRRPDQIALHEQLKDGRIGLYVVALLARRHGISVTLQHNMYGGTRASLLLPAGLLDTTTAVTNPPQVAATMPSTVGAPSPLWAAPPMQRPATVTAINNAASAPASHRERPALPRRPRPAYRQTIAQEAAGQAASGEARPDLMAQFTQGVQRAIEPRPTT